MCGISLRRYGFTKCNCNRTPSKLDVTIMLIFNKTQTFVAFLLSVALSSRGISDPPDTTGGNHISPDTAGYSDNTTISTPDIITTPVTPGSPFEYSVSGNEIIVRDETELLDAINNARAGDVITVVNGFFTLGNRVRLDADGSLKNPITLRAADTRKTEITFSQNKGEVEGFVVRGSHWIIDGLVLNSDCTIDQHSNCEHAFHIKGGAEGLWIRNNQIIDFNTAIKGSGSDNNYADNVRIEHNEIFNTSVRMTSIPVTPVDINGGDSWLVYKNLIYDFAKGTGNKISYGAFLKANSSNGLFDSNWVHCEKDVFESGSRIGLSFGGGGNKPIDSPICTDADCSHLHRNGRMTNNFITNCSDVGIYINASSDTTLDHNTLYETNGVDVRFGTSTTNIVANLLVGGALRERDDGQILQNSDNTIQNAGSISSLPALLGIIEPHSLTGPFQDYDICGYQRQTSYIGAIGGSSVEQEACLTVFY